MTILRSVAEDVLHVVSSKRARTAHAHARARAPIAYTHTRAAARSVLTP